MLKGHRQKSTTKQTLSTRIILWVTVTGISSVTCMVSVCACACPSLLLMLCYVVLCCAVLCRAKLCCIGCDVISGVVLIAVPCHGNQNATNLPSIRIFVRQHLQSQEEQVILQLNVAVSFLPARPPPSSLRLPPSGSLPPSFPPSLLPVCLSVSQPPSRLSVCLSVCLSLTRASLAHLN